MPQKIRYIPNPHTITAPSGATVAPVMREIRMGNEIRTEAHYTDPTTGQFITKVLVSTRSVDESK
jgi:hypothetical protein|tara:strand:+ start:118 stop:312 length:195 start_codon:yes stop_codon:yes gene_type:complete